MGQSLLAERHFAVQEWDTLFEIGGELQDTLLLMPFAVEWWNNQLVVTDDITQRLMVFDGNDGSFRWATGGVGGGPKEFEWIVDIKTTPEGNLSVIDAGNARVTELDATGSVVRTRPIGDLPTIAWSVLDLGGWNVAVMNRHPGGIAVLDDSLRLVRLVSYAWPETILPHATVTSRIARHPSRLGLWVSAFGYGPGFIVWDGIEGRAHRFIQPVPFARPVSREEQRRGGDDSRDCAAVSVAIHGDEIYVLFGGGPRSRSEPDGAPTTLIDIYSFEGQYRRSFLLPSSAGDFATNGESIFIRHRVSEKPSVLALRPLPGDAAVSMTVGLRDGIGERQ